MRYLRAIFIIIALSTCAFADGNFDTSFNGNGRVWGGFGLGKDLATSSVRLPDGKIVVAGTATNGYEDKVFLARYNADGTLDGSFGNGGSILSDILSYDDAATRKPLVELDSDGTLVILTGASVLRFSANGALVKVFDSPALHTWENAAFNAISLQSDGKVIAAGQFQSSGGDYDALAVRYNADGSLDQSFGVGGRFILPVPNSYENIGAVAIQADGNIVLGGSISAAGAYAFVVRVTSDGRPDPRFNRYGSVIIAPGPFLGLSVVIQNDQKIVMLGQNGFNTSIFELVRLNQNGMVDSAFGNNGHVMQGSDDGTPLALRTGKLVLQSNGKLVAAGYTENAGVLKLQAMRFNQDGALDGSFGNGGIFTQMGVKPSSLMLDSNQNLVFSGAAYMGTVLGTKHYDSLLLRVNSLGIVDNAFGDQGKATLDVGNREAFAVGIHAQADNKVVVVGGLSTEPQPNQFVPKFFGAARFNENGTPDMSFGNRGRVLYDLGARITSSMLQPDGKILLVGETSDLKFLVARLNSNGSLDTTFSGDGVASADFGNSEAIARAVAMQSDGKIILAGDVSNDFAMARFDQNGNLDPSFNFGGLVLTNLQGRGPTKSTDYVAAIAVQADNKIIVSGNTRAVSESWTDSALVRYNANGDINYKFGLDGIVITKLGEANDSAESLYLQSDGKIVVAGASSSYSSFATTVVVSRYTESGALDDSFGTGGLVKPDIDHWWMGGGYAVKAQADGKLIFAGNTDLPKVGRINTDGSVDPTWGTLGFFKFNEPNGTKAIAKLDIDPQGRIVAFANWGAFSLVRLTDEQVSRPALRAFSKK
jgi:uncharacterized delta-60 repeat protein